MGREEIREITLNAMDYENVTFTQIDRGIASLGLLNKYNSSAAILSAEWNGDNNYVIKMIDGGRIGIYSDKEPSRVLINQSDITWLYYKSTGLLEIDAPEGDEIAVKIIFK